MIAALVVGALIALTVGCTSLLLLLNRQPPAPEPSSDFASYGSQTIEWGACDSGRSDVQCAWVYAPLDWGEVDAETDSDADADAGTDAGPASAHRADDIRLRLTKHPAEGGEAIGTLFVNRGGPGATGADYIENSYDGAVRAEVRQRFDVIGWDPRGVGESSAVHCLDDAGLDDFLYGTGDPEEDGAFLEFGSDEWIRASIDATADFGEACLEETGELLAHVDTGSTVRDLDMLREIVGDPKLNFLGYSYGTMIGALYADAFPERVGRLVLDGAVDPTTDYVESAREQGVGAETALRGYLADCPNRSKCPFTGSVDAGMREIDQLLERVEAAPIRADDGRMLYDGTFFTAIMAALYTPSSWAYLDEAIAGLREGNAAPAFVLADHYNQRVDGHYGTNLMEAFIAINCLDYPREEPDFDEMRAEAAETMRVAPVAGRYHAFGETACAGWPVPAVNVTHRVSGAGADPILIVGTTGDPATPYRAALALTDQLESGVLLTFEGEGHTAYGENDCVDAVVNEYLLTGKTPDPADAVCRE